MVNNYFSKSEWVTVHGIDMSKKKENEKRRLEAAVVFCSLLLYAVCNMFSLFVTFGKNDNSFQKKKKNSDYELPLLLFC